MEMGAHFNQDDLFVHGKEYTIGTNDGAQFRRVQFMGTKLYHGKPMMTFKTISGEQITINPSFHSFTIQEPTIKEEVKETDNGKTDSETS